MVNDAIVKRYQNETESAHMGCAVLDPFIILHDGDTLLDLGCGNGSQCVKLAEQSEGRVKIIGLDLTEAMIKKAKAIHQRKTITYLVGDIHALPIEQESVDVVLSNCVINHSPDKYKVYTEIYRVLKTGGYFLIGDIASEGWLPDSIRNDPEAVAECYGGAIPEDEYLAVIKKAGFEEVTVFSRRKYQKKGFPIESLIIKGVKS